MIEMELILLVVLAFIGMGVVMGGYLLNEVIQDLKEIKAMLEER